MVCDPRGPPRPPGDPRGDPGGPPRAPADPRGDPRGPPRTPGDPRGTPRLPVKTVCGQLRKKECKKTPGCIKVKGQGCKGTYENRADCEAIPKKKWCRKAGCALKVEDVRERGRLRSHPKEEVVQEGGLCPESRGRLRLRGLLGLRGGRRSR